MPTVLQINTVVNYSSTGRIAEEIGSLVIDNGWKSYIAYGRYERKSKSKLIKIGSDFGIKLHVIQTRLFDRNGLGSYHATKNLIEQIEVIKPDVIHLHNLHGYYLNIQILFEFFSQVDIPIVWTLHDCWPFTGHCTYFDFVGCEKWKTQCFRCPQKNNYPSSFLIDRSRKNYLLKKEIFNSLNNLNLIAVSDWLEGLIKQSFLKSHPVKVINNGIDLTSFSPQGADSKEQIKTKYKLNGKFCILGVANQWLPRKGFNDIMELSQVIGSDDIILLVGLNKKQKANLPTNVKGILRTESTNELAALYSASDVYINPTLEDNFPTSNLEALACGTPIITYKTGGSIESVTAATGFVVEKGNVMGLVDAVNKVKKYWKRRIHCSMQAKS